jgi:hypothetical protein
MGTSFGRTVLSWRGCFRQTGLLSFSLPGVHEQRRLGCMRVDFGTTGCLRHPRRSAHLAGANRWGRTC